MTYESRLVRDLARTMTEPLLTCETVLAEAAFHLGSSIYILSLIPDESFAWPLIAVGTWIDCNN